jgi:hypothetical protein
MWMGNGAVISGFFLAFIMSLESYIRKELKLDYTIPVIMGIMSILISILSRGRKPSKFWRILSDLAKGESVDLGVDLYKSQIEKDTPKTQIKKDN